jgi:hypothetical protein
VKLEGSFDTFSLPEIFQLLTATKKSGGLHVFRGTQHGVIRLVDGAVSGATSDTARQSLVRRLVGAGQLPDEALSAGVATVRNDPTAGFARALQEAGAVDSALLLGVAREHTVDALFDVLRWIEGTFAFDVNEADHDDLGLRESAEALVGLAGQRIDAWPALSGQISSPDVVLRLAPAPAHDPVLTRDEWALVALIDGRRTVHDLVALCGRGEFAVVAALAPLVERGLLEVPSGQGDDVVTALVRRQLLVESVETPAEQVRSTVPAPRAPQPPDQVPSSPPPPPVPIAVEPARPVSLAAPVPAAPSAWSQEGTPKLSPQLQGSRRSHQSAGAEDVPEPAADPQHAVIERDPAVDSGMLARLVAGVRAV